MLTDRGTGVGSCSMVTVFALGVCIKVCQHSSDPLNSLFIYLVVPAQQYRASMHTVPFEEITTLLCLTSNRFQTKEAKCSENDPTQATF